MRAILTYHSIDPSGSPISIAPEVFDRHVEWLAGGRVRVEPLAQLAATPAPASDGRPRVALTFDDGFETFGTYAWPRLRDRGLPATVFVVSGHVGRTNAWGGRPSPGIPELPLLTWRGLAAVASEGAAIGAHSRSHPHLPDLEPAALDEELAGGQQDLADRLGGRPAHVCYPYGDVSEAVVAAAARYYALGCTTEYRVVGDGAPVLRLPRLDMGYFQHPGAFDDWGQPSFLRRIATRRAARAVRAWWTRR
jgi:peptidoglycan/xylan/chitin deacetylase (PgdA/CDA1 family)